MIVISCEFSGERVKASPYAKKLAREAGVDISQASATGPDGRIVAADVQKLIDSGGGKAAPADDKAAPSKDAAAPGAPHRTEVRLISAVFRVAVPQPAEFVTESKLPLAKTKTC